MPFAYTDFFFFFFKDGMITQQTYAFATGIIEAYYTDVPNTGSVAHVMSHKRKYCHTLSPGQMVVSQLERCVVPKDPTISRRQKSVYVESPISTRNAFDIYPFNHVVLNRMESEEEWTKFFVTTNKQI